MKLASTLLLLLAAIASPAARAFSIESSGAAAPPEDVVGEHQPLQRSWTVSSLEELEKLHVLVPGRVFVDLEAALAALETPAPTTAAPATHIPVVVTEKPATPAPTTAEPTTTEPPTKVPVVVEVGSSSSGSSDNSDDVVFPTPVPTVTQKKTNAPKAVADGSSSLEGSNSGSSVGAINIGDLTTQLRRRDDSDDESDDDEKTHKKHSKPKEAAVAKIVVTGNSSALLDLFEVLPLHPKRQNGLKLHLKNEDATVEGFVLTQIILSNPNYLRHLRVALADDVVVGDGIFVEDDKDTTVKIATSGAGKVFVKSSANVSLDALKVDVAGSGLVQFQVPSLKLQDTLDVNVAGSGAIGLLADASLKTTEIKAAVSGTGKLVVETSKLTADDLVAAVYGDGSTSFATAGNVTNEKLTLSGSGNVLVGSIAAERASVDVWGSGNVIVQVAQKLKVSTSFSGSVGYVGERPAKVKTSKWLFWRSDIVHPAGENKVVKYEVAATPARYPTYTSLVTKQVYYADEPIVKVATGAAPSYITAVSTHLSTVAHGPNGFLIFSMVATTLVVVGLAANSLHRRHVRRHYRPLV